MFPLALAQVGAGVGGYSIIGLLIILIIVGGCIAVAFIAARAMGWAPPPWVIQIFWVCIVVVVAIVAIRFLASL